MGAAPAMIDRILSSTKNISARQFALFRIAFGAYLAVHFAQLLPYGTELFSRVGVLADPRLNFTFGVLPNPLESFGQPALVQAFLATAVLLSIALALGLYRRTVCLLLWYTWACLFNRNNLISNPGIPYVGLILVLCAILPRGDDLCLHRRPRHPDRPPARWRFPGQVYWTAWILLAAGYTFSGLMKLQSPSWLDGTAMVHLVNNPLARPGPIRDLFLGLPPAITALATWSALAIEVLFLPATFWRWSRWAVWSAALLMHIGILTMVAFADLTLGMVMIHLFTWDPEWVGKSKPGNGLAA
jgi:hypothetical protein